MCRYPVACPCQIMICFCCREKPRLDWLHLNHWGFNHRKWKREKVRCFVNVALLIRNRWLQGDSLEMYLSVCSISLLGRADVPRCQTVIGWIILISCLICNFFFFFSMMWLIFSQQSAHYDFHKALRSHWDRRFCCCGLRKKRRVLTSDKLRTCKCCGIYAQLLLSVDQWTG